MIRKSLSILFLILSVLTLYAEKTNYLYSFNSDLNEGISQLSVMTIYQDSRGYLWFATKNGLNRFNGKEYKIYHREDGNEQSLSNNRRSRRLPLGRNQQWTEPDRSEHK